MKRGWLVGLVLLVAVTAAPLPSPAAPQYGTERGRLSCPRFVRAGTAIEVSGSGFASGVVVSLRFDRRPANPPSTMADSSGDVSVEFGVPARARRGAHHVTASGSTSDGDRLVLRCNVVVRVKPKGR